MKHLIFLLLLSGSCTAQTYNISVWKGYKDKVKLSAYGKEDSLLLAEHPEKVKSFIYSGMFDPFSTIGEGHRNDFEPVFLYFLSHIEQFKNLEYLEIKNIAFNSLPARIGCLHKLKYLAITNCSIAEGYGPLSSIKSLETLYLYGLQAEMRSINFMMLKKLKHLNYVPSINDSFCKPLFDSICQIKKLKDLEFSWYSLDYIPPHVAYLRHLRSLSITALFASELPSQIGNLKKLRRLSIANTRISDIPPELFNIRKLELDVGLCNMDGGNFSKLQLASLMNNMPCRWRVHCW